MHTPVHERHTTDEDGQALVTLTTCKSSFPRVTWRDEIWIMRSVAHCMLEWHLALMKTASVALFFCNFTFPRDPSYAPDASNPAKTNSTRLDATCGTADNG